MGGCCRGVDMKLRKRSWGRVRDLKMKGDWPCDALRMSQVPRADSNLHIKGDMWFSIGPSADEIPASLYQDTMPP